MAEIPMEELLSKSPLKPSHPFPMLVEAASAIEKEISSMNRHVTEEEMEALRKKYPEICRVEAMFWEDLAKGNLLKSPGRTSAKPSPLAEVAPESEDATPAVFNDIGNYISSRTGRKFLANGSPRTAIDDMDAPGSRVE